MGAPGRLLMVLPSNPAWLIRFPRVSELHRPTFRLIQGTRHRFYTTYRSWLWKECLILLIVVKSSRQESTSHHLDDARLWQEGSGNEVRVVLQAKFHEANESGRIHLGLTVSRAHPDGLGCTISPTYYVSFVLLPYVQTSVFFANQ